MAKRGRPRKSLGPLDPSTKRYREQVDEQKATALRVQAEAAAAAAAGPPRLAELDPYWVLDAAAAYRESLCRPALAKVYRDHAEDYLLRAAVRLEETGPSPSGRFRDESPPPMDEAAIMAAAKHYRDTVLRCAAPVLRGRGVAFWVMEDGPADEVAGAELDYLNTVREGVAGRMYEDEA